MINAIFDQFVEATPVTVMVRGIMERVFEPTALDKLFETYRVKQYTRELLFSNVVTLMSLVVSGIHPSVSAAYKALEKDLIFVDRVFLSMLHVLFLETVCLWHLLMHLIFVDKVLSLMLQPVPGMSPQGEGTA